MTRGAPSVTVIVPAFNAAATVLETIASVRRQTLRDIEIIVVDDGSTDDTLALLRAVQDDRLRLICGGHAGVAAARNRGIEAARGEFVSFLDADDLWTPDKLELQVAALDRRNAAGLAYSWTALIDRRGAYLFAKEPSVVEGDVYAELLRDCFVASCSNVLVRRRCFDAVGGFDGGMGAAQDWDLCLRIADRWSFAVVPRYQVLYRIWDAAMSADAERSERACLLLCARTFARTPAIPAARRQEMLANVKQYVAFLYLTRGVGVDFRIEAGRRLRECIRLYPRSLLTFKTESLLLTWALLRLLPASMARPAVTTLLRSYGRWQAATRREVRELVRGALPTMRLRGGERVAS